MKCFLETLDVGQAGGSPLEEHLVLGLGDIQSFLRNSCLSQQSALPAAL